MIRFISCDNFHLFDLIRWNDLLWKYIYSLAPIFVVSNITGNTQWEICISLDFDFHGLSEPRYPWKLEPNDK